MGARNRRRHQVGGQADDLGLAHETDAEGRLTCIHRRIHCVATPDTTEDEDELDRIQIDNFLNTLAEVALPAAHRKEQLEP